MKAKQFLKLLSGYLRHTLNAADRSLLQRWYDSFGEDETGVPGLEDNASEEKLREELRQRVYKAARHAGEAAEPGKWSFRKIAAAIALLAMAGSACWMLVGSPGRPSRNLAGGEISYRIFSTGVHQVKKIQLPDGSTLYLNANSSIRIPSFSAKQPRQVYLDEGEAFFEVAKDSERPFLVHAASLMINVLGTSFNVQSYARLDRISVSVASGQIQVSDSLQVFHKITANQELTYLRKSAGAKLSSTGPGQRNAWIKGVIPLEKAGFEELAVAMNNLYGIHLQSRDNRTPSFSYNITLRSDRSLEKTLELICSLHHTKFRRDGNDVMIYP